MMIMIMMIMMVTAHWRLSTDVWWLMLTLSMKIEVFVVFFCEKGPPPSRRFRLFSGISFKSVPPMSDGGIFCSKAS